MIDRHTLSLAAEYAVASELCRRGIYTQLTLGNLKRTDLLALTESGNVVRVEVKAKQGNIWPGCKGIYGEHSVIVFVDFQNKTIDERLNFYILDEKEWHNLLLKKKRQYKKANPNKNMSIKKNVPIYDDQLTKSGKPYTGTSVNINDISGFKDSWHTIDKILKTV